MAEAGVSGSGNDGVAVGEGAPGDADGRVVVSRAVEDGGEVQGDLAVAGILSQRLMEELNSRFEVPLV